MTSPVAVRQRHYGLIVFSRLFGAKCGRCNLGFSKSDFVMRAKDRIFHVGCFSCTACHRQLYPGDEFVLNNEELLCKDHDVLMEADFISKTELQILLLNRFEIFLKIVLHQRKKGEKSQINKMVTNAFLIDFLYVLTRGFKFSAPSKYILAGKSFLEYVV